MKLQSLKLVSGILAGILIVFICNLVANAATKERAMNIEASNLETAVFGGGCFWCTEAVFENLQGTYEVEVGYAGGTMPSPNYEAVSAGKGGHAEVTRVTFDPKIISYEELLEVFFHTHDPTTLNQQGADIGEQYRSLILYKDQAQKQSAETVKARIDKSGLWSKPIVTEIKALENFYKAEDYHQDYYQKNSSNRYCSLVIAPKLQKLYRDFAHKLKRKQS